MKLTPRMEELLDLVRRAGRPPFYKLSVQDARAAYESVAEILDLPRAPLARVQDLHVETEPGVKLKARLYAPTTDTHLPVLLYLHGGGFVIGSLETHDSLCRTLVLGAGCAVLALDYRLAPEHPFPAAVQDAWGALQWLARHAKSLGLDAHRIAVGGDSAGGTLAAVCAIYARDEGLPLSLQVLITPGAAATMDSPSMQRFASGYLLEKQGIEWFFNHYAGQADRIDWRFAPLEHGDLDGVAPAWVGLAEFDPLVDDGLAYADRLRAASNRVQLELYRGVTHDFIKLGRYIPEALQAQDAIAAALREAFQP
jgi:acetyl esterase